MKNKKNELKDELLSKVSGGSETEKEHSPACAWLMKHHDTLIARADLMPVVGENIYSHAHLKVNQLTILLLWNENKYTLEEVKQQLRDEGIQVDDLVEY